MSKVTLPWGTLPPIILAALADGATSGADVQRWIAKRTGGVYEPGGGALYPRLASLEVQGLLTRSGNHKPQNYALTEAGQQRAEDLRGEAKQALKRLRAQGASE